MMSIVAFIIHCPFLGTDYFHESKAYVQTHKFRHVGAQWRLSIKLTERSFGLSYWATIFLEKTDGGFQLVMGVTRIHGWFLLGKIPSFEMDDH